MVGAPPNLLVLLCSNSTCFFFIAKGTEAPCLTSKQASCVQYRKIIKNYTATFWNCLIHDTSIKPKGLKRRKLSLHGSKIGFIREPVVAVWTLLGDLASKTFVAASWRLICRPSSPKCLNHLMTEQRLPKGLGWWGSGNDEIVVEFSLSWEVFLCAADLVIVLARMPDLTFNLDVTRFSTIPTLVVLHVTCRWNQP